MFEVDEAAKIITESVDSDANIIFGATINEEYNGELKITVVATGFDEDTNTTYVETSKAKAQITNPFGRKAVSDSRITPAPTQAPAPAQDDLDVPSFLRKKM
jgi:cell division protein FtsZ